MYAMSEAGFVAREFRKNMNQSSSQSGSQDGSQNAGASSQVSLQESELERKVTIAMTEDSRKGLKVLVDAYYKKAYHLALGMVGNRDDALDVTQEAFIRVQRSYHTFDSERRFFPWFYTILSNLAKTTLTRRSRRSGREVEYQELTIAADSSFSPETQTLKREEIGQLRTALSELSFADREIITLQHFQDLSYDEISETLDIPRGTVMSRLYYARKRLAEKMDLYNNTDSSNTDETGATSATDDTTARGESK